MTMLLDDLLATEATLQILRDAQRNLLKAQTALELHATYSKNTKKIQQNVIAGINDMIAEVNDEELNARSLQRTLIRDLRKIEGEN